jgi:UDP:flavonoid glycosyltransferase YjiC (YdhE family)
MAAIVRSLPPPCAAIQVLSPPALQNPEIAGLAAVQPMRPAAGETQLADRSELLDLLPEVPVVYVTLGTIWNTDLDVFRIVIDALREHVNVIVTVGRQNDPAALGEQVARRHVRRTRDSIGLMARVGRAVAARQRDRAQLHPPTRTAAVV